MTAESFHRQRLAPTGPASSNFQLPNTFKKDKAENNLNLKEAVDGVERDEQRKVFPLTEVGSNYLMMSSCFFILPGYYAFSEGLTLHLATSAVTTLASINYWRNAVPGWRRTTDMLIAKMSFLIYFATGIYHIEEAIVFRIAWLICFVIALCYFSSNKLWGEDSHLWIFSHMSFHFFVALGQYTVLVGSFGKFWNFRGLLWSANIWYHPLYTIQNGLVLQCRRCQMLWLSCNGLQSSSFPHITACWMDEIRETPYNRETKY